MGALANSLSSAGFTGRVFAGFRGSLPASFNGRYVTHADGTHTMPWGGLEVVLVPVKTDRHLTNFKPEFMLDVWTHHARECTKLFYFDSDIVVLARWDYFESWVEAGVALVMDFNTPVPINHPLRVAWRKHFSPLGFKFAPQNDYYFNAGFVGVARDWKHALVAWREVQTALAELVPLDLPIGMRGAPKHMRNRLFPFYLTDQDAINVVADLEGVTVSPMGIEGMGWKLPHVYMVHALGVPKPWRGRYLRQAWRGNGPRVSDKAFWRYADRPVALFSARHIRKMKRRMKWAHVLAPLGKWAQNVRELFSGGGLFG
jgi:hypothetical protein